MCYGWSLISVSVSSLLCGLSEIQVLLGGAVMFLSLPAPWISLNLCPRVLLVWLMND